MSTAERRQAERHTRADEMLIKVLASDTDQEVDGRIYACASADVSASGLRLSSSVALSEGARLDLRLRAGDKRFVLTGVVRWARVDGDAHLAGIEFEASTGDDVNAWRDWVGAL